LTTSNTIQQPVGHKVAPRLSRCYLQTISALSPRHVTSQPQSDSHLSTHGAASRQPSI